jgi:hypothetical protein
MALGCHLQSQQTKLLRRVPPVGRPGARCGDGAANRWLDSLCCGSRAPVFSRDLDLIRVADPMPAAVVVDCWLDSVPPDLPVRDPQQACRAALHPWKDVVTVTDAAVLLPGHTNRVASASARDLCGATGELRKKARMTLAHRCEVLLAQPPANTVGARSDWSALGAQSTK